MVGRPKRKYVPKMKTISLEIEIEPRPVQSTKFTKIGRFPRAYVPRETKEYTKEIKDRIIVPDGWEPIVGGITVKELTFSFFRKGYKFEDGKDYAPYIKRKDIDNLIKGFMDALEGVLFQDDCQIHTYENVRKIVSRKSYMKVVFEYDENLQTKEAQQAYKDKIEEKHQKIIEKKRAKLANWRARQKENEENKENTLSENGGLDSTVDKL